MRPDRGSITGFVVVMVIVVMTCAGLAVDGSRIVGAKVSAADHAENAARVGAQQVTALRDGGWAIDPNRARSAAEAYLGNHAVSGTVQVTATRITVTVSIVVSMTLLDLVGVAPERVSATRSSDPIAG